ncbi:glycosyltransferase [Candidatus Parcubacteria bacterium]|nr:glycosyltransferase [Candidatus Parcubacteria bacterium]
MVNILASIDRQQYSVSLVLAEKSGVFLDQIPKDIPLVDLRGSSAINVFFKLLQYLRREKPDIFVSMFTRFNLIALLIKMVSGLKTRFLIIEHTTPSRLHLTAKRFSHKIIAYFFLSSLLKFFYPRADKIICVSAGIQEDVAKFIPISDKITVVYNPVISGQVHQLAAQRTEHSWLVDKKVPVVMAMGRLVAAKDYPTLLKAFTLASAQMPLRLIILGEGIGKEPLVALARKMNISDSVDFLGFKNNPYGYLSAADLFISSSMREGFSNAIVEAMACGVPVIATRCAGPEEIIEDGKNGILVPIGAEKTLSEQIIRVLTDKVLSEKLSMEGKKRSDFFQVEKSVNGYSDVFQELMGAANTAI